MYTTALEMHIEVLQGLQKVAAYEEDMFNPEEIDLHLTKQQNRLVEEIVTRRFQDIQTGLDFIRPLMVKNKKLQVILPAASDVIYEPNMVYAVLPANYLHLTTDRSRVITSSTYPYCDDMSSFKTTAVLNTYNEKVAAVQMVTTTATVAPFYYNFKVVLTKAGNPVEFTVPTALNNIKSKNSSFSISNYILENYAFPQTQVYWEYYRDNYYPNAFVFVTTDPEITAVSLTTQVSSSDTNPAGVSTANFVSTNYTIPNYVSGTTLPQIPGYISTYTANLLVEADELYEQSLNKFYKPVKTNPRSSLASNFILGYESKNFLISELIIDYIRIPRQISLSLDQVSELAGNAPSIIVDRTIEYLKLTIENPAYIGTVQDNKLRNPI